jgi:hypothetical protein
MTPSSTGSTLRGWRCNCACAYIVELNGHVIFNSLDFVSDCALVHHDHLTVPPPTLSLTLAPKHQEALNNSGVSPRLHLDQSCPAIFILSEIGKGNTLSDEDLPDDNELISAIQSVTVQGRSTPLPTTPSDLQDSDPTYEIGTQPGSKWTQRKLWKLPCCTQTHIPLSPPDEVRWYSVLTEITLHGSSAHSPHVSPTA